MPSKSGVKRHYLRQKIRQAGESASSLVAGHVVSLLEKIKWAKRNGYLQRKPGAKGRGSYSLSPIGRYEFYFQLGHEKPWRNLTPAQRKRAARTIIEGALAKYGRYNPIRSARATIHTPLNQSLAGFIFIDLERLRQQAENQQRMFKRQRDDAGRSGILPEDIRRARNSITIFQAVFEGLQRGTYSLES